MLNNDCSLFLDCSTVFFKFYPILVERLQFSVNSIADHCLSKTLISRQTYREIMDLNISKEDKTRKLLMDVEQNISSRTEAFEDFCEVLKSCEFRDLVVSLTSETT